MAPLRHAAAALPRKCAGLHESHSLAHALASTEHERIPCVTSPPCGHAMMQALVAEMVGNFGKRLEPFGMKVGGRAGGWAQL